MTSRVKLDPKKVVVVREGIGGGMVTPNLTTIETRIREVTE